LRKFVPLVFETGHAKHDSAYSYIATLSIVIFPAAFLYFLTPT